MLNLTAIHCFTPQISVHCTEYQFCAATNAEVRGKKKI